MENETSTDRSGDSDRIQAIERKLGLLVSFSIGQTALLVVILALMLMEQVMPTWSTMLMFFVMLALTAYIFRGQLPGLIRKVGSYLLGKILTSKSMNSSNDIS
jgi:hypothetical protein